MKKTKTILLFAIMLCSCTPKKGLDQFSWLQGSWMGRQDGIVFSEDWKKVSEEMITGRSLALQGEDTVYHETSKIYMLGGAPYFLMNLPQLHEPVLFKWSSGEDKEALFQSTEHDFPQSVLYKLEGDSLLERLEGIRDGKKAREELYYHKK
jgi:hypothetical protein